MQQGIEGPIKLSGSTPELDDFTIRIVDGKRSRLLGTHYALNLLKVKRIAQSPMDLMPSALRNASERHTTWDAT